MNFVLRVWLVAFATLAGVVLGAPLQEHPRLLFHADQLADLRSRMTPVNPVWAPFNGIVEEMMNDYKRGRAANGDLIDVDGTVKPGSYDRAMPEDDDGNYEATSKPSETYAMVFAFMSLLETNATKRLEYIDAAKTCLFRVIDISVLGHDPNNPGLAFRQKGFAQSQRSFYAEAFPFTVDWLLAHGSNTFTALEKAKLRKCFLEWAHDCRDHFYFAPYNPEGFYNDPKLFRFFEQQAADTRDALRLSLNNHWANHERAIGLYAMCFDPADDIPNAGIGDTAPAGALTGFTQAPGGEWIYQNTGELRNATGVWLYMTDYALRHDGGGGISQEGAMYASNGLGPVALLLSCLRSSGQDDVGRWGSQVSLENHPFWWQVVRGSFALVPPAPRPLKLGLEYAGPMYENVPWGDMQNYGMDDVFVKVFAPLALVDIAEHGINAPFAQQARWFLKNLPTGGAAAFQSRIRQLSANARWRDAIYYFLLFDPKAAEPTDPRPGEPKSYWAQFNDAGTMGSIFARSGNSASDAYFDYRLGWNRIDHQGGDGNSVELWFNGVWITRRWAGYGARTLCSDYQNTFAFGNWTPADPNYGLLTTLPHDNGGQFPYGEVGDPVIRARSLAPNYAFVTGDATPLYNSYQHAELREVTDATRSTLWLKPGTMVVYDRAATKSASAKRQWFNLQKAPAISGNTASLTVVDQWQTSEWNNDLQQSIYTDHAVAKADVRITSVLPATTLSVDTTLPMIPGGNQETAVGEEQKARLKIEANGDPQSARMLSVIESVLPGAGNHNATALVANNFEGAAIGDTVVMFKSDLNAAFTGLAYTAPAGAARHFITGLAPNTAYGVQLNGNQVAINPNGATHVTDAGGVLVLGNEPTTVAISTPAPTANEGAVATFTVGRSGSLTDALDVQYSIGGTATPAVDFGALSGHVTIPAGAATASIQVNVTDDLLFEGQETVALTLAPGAGYSVDDGSPAATLTIIDNDAPPGGYIQFSNAAFTATEGSAAAITVKRVGGSVGSVSALVTLAYGTAGASDIAGGNQTISWADGDSSDKTIAFATIDDAVYEGDETASVTLSGVTGQAVVGALSTALVTLTDNDPAPPGQISFGAATYSAGEDSGHLNISLTRANGSGGAATVKISVIGGTATLGSDFTISATEITWAAGESGAKSVTLNLINDLAFEGEENALLNLSIVSGNATLGGIASATVTILDDDPEPQDYDVGDGFPYPNIGSIPWKNLGSGAVVRIHYRATPYSEKILISGRGTAEAPIKIIGVAGPNGERPVINGANATSALNLGYENSSYTPLLGIVAIARGSKTPSNIKPGYVELSGLDIGGSNGQNYTNTTGGVEAYWSSGGALYLRGAEHVVVRNCVFHHAPNGLVAECYSSESEINRDLQIENCWFHDNAVANTYSQNNLHIEGIGVVVQGCRFSPNVNRDKSANISDRSAGAIYRYNWVEGGSYLIEMIEPSGAPAIISADPAYATTHVYGNILLNKDGDGSSLIDFGASFGSAEWFRTNLRFYHNTVIVGGFSTRSLFSMVGPEVQVDARNNVFYNSAGALQMGSTSGSIDLGVNWIKTGWSDGPAATVTGAQNLITGIDPGFADAATLDFRLASNSPLRNHAAPLPVDWPKPLLEYPLTPRASLKDLGAFAFPLPSAPTLTIIAGPGGITLNAAVAPNSGWELFRSSDLSSWQSLGVFNANGAGALSYQATASGNSAFYRLKSTD